MTHLNNIFEWTEKKNRIFFLKHNKSIKRNVHVTRNHYWTKRWNIFPTNTYCVVCFKIHSIGAVFPLSIIIKSESRMKKRKFQRFSIYIHKNSFLLLSFDTIALLLSNDIMEKNRIFDENRFAFSPIEIDDDVMCLRILNYLTFSAFILFVMIIKKKSCNIDGSIFHSSIYCNKIA